MRVNGASKIALSLKLTDSLMGLVAFFTAYYLRNFGPFRLLLESIQPLRIYLAALPFAILLLLVVYNIFGLYDQTKRTKAFSESFLVIKATSFWVLLIMAGSYLYKYDYSRIIVVVFYLLTLLFISLGRSLFRVIEQKYYRQGYSLVKILIIGAGRPGRQLARKLGDFSQIGYRLVGFLDDRAQSRKHFPVIGRVKDIARVVKRYTVDEVYITDPTLAHSKILDLMSKVPKKSLRFRVVSSMFDLVSGAVDVGRLESIPSLELWRVGGGWPKNAKRTFDLMFALTLYITTSPLWLLISLAIFFTGGSPILLKQKRVGLMGKQFLMLKFRTMAKDTPIYADSPKSQKDKRVTPIGKLLRKTSLDELPQLINVIRGEMSMVGPRPEMPQKVIKYQAWQKKRLEVKPGITGLWQVLGRKDLPLQDNLEYDFYYINNQSFLLDMAIILKTIPIVLTGKGAY
ncbi:hypothetical protein A2115_02545 [Candidatus Woesebacteria bacterium GWA1_41_8]|uniref:Bacterial sugar transferase domain-containing protein n=1 Tax=Candidatus Woesebacteria bacterium GWA1_41_8 TaxID=1802471 RepID=A0A1F7WI11_9BACT|nr:MAG: hypothetical protein A2115_02545 [Candidatus Woesebacteria bacterium GWA1_41_8]